MEAVTEVEVFKHLVVRDENDMEEREQVRKQISIFKKRVPTNIFENEYYILYEALVKAAQYETVLTYTQMYQIIINNINKFMDNPAVHLEDICEDTFDKNQVRDTLAEQCMYRYEELRGEPVSDAGELKMSLDLYLQSWASHELQKVISDQHHILTQGKTIKGKFLHGLEDSHTYYTNEYAKLRELVVADLNDMANIIRTDMSYEEVNRLFQQESISKTVACTGVRGVDEPIGYFRKGDCVSVMGQPGAGKTRFSANILYNGLMMGNNAVWYALEGNALQAFSLLVARHILTLHRDISELDDKRIFDCSYSEDYNDIVMSAIIDLLRNQKYGKVVIKNVPLYDDEVMDDLGALWDSGFMFDIVMIDYVSLVMNKNHENPSTYLSRLVKSLKSYAMSFRNSGYLLVLPHQLTREVILALMQGKDTTIVGSSDTGEVIKSSDISFALSRTDEQFITDCMTIHFTKTRFAKHLPALEVLALHGKCYFTDKDVA